MIDPRVKSEARAENNKSRASKWGIVTLCRSTTFKDTVEPGDSKPIDSKLLALVNFLLLTNSFIT